MFSYYGSKSKLVEYYPPPKHNRIIEPFAGSARYSLHHWKNDVLLVDKYPVVVELWKWLINATKNDILDLPILKKGDDIREIEMPNEARYLIGFSINKGSSAPRNVVTEWGEPGWNFTRKNIAENLYKIKHWQIINCHYNELPNDNATWFIDPPYQFGGEHYKENSRKINFNQLAEWCQNRNGQVIVCENTKADWLPFKPMIDFVGAYDTTTEAIWSNHKTNYDYQQLSFL
jgi:site-specific DNA-adenine methylase